MGRHHDDGLDGPDQQDLDVAESPPRRPRVWPLPLVVAVAFAAVMAALMVQISTLGERVRQAESDRQVLSEQVERLGGVPLVSPSSGPPGERGDVGPQGDPGRPPTTAEIGAAVAAYLAEHPPAAGRAPSAAQIGAAVSAYLQQHPPARGPAGEKGDPGEPGETVTGSPGPRGEPGPESTVAGPQGESGPRGEPGPPPAGWTFVYGGVTYTCSPAEPGSTTYRCEGA
ncbi:hypothetical protein GCM10022419_034000 [Nonomuraea rosea]|uniref:Collagen-like protein n=2 Tax=Nonomuraea rosea TaxID=638574 RepID=A0ABP6WJ86_9ACTN